MKLRNLYRIIIGALMVISGIVSIVLTAGEANIGSMLLAAGIVFLVTGITHHRRYGDDPESDERSKKIGAYVAYSGWIIWGCSNLVYKMHSCFPSLSLHSPRRSIRLISSGKGMSVDDHNDISEFIDRGFVNSGRGSSHPCP